MADAAEHSGARAWLPGVPQAGVDRTPTARPTRAVARGPAPRPGRRAASDAERGAGRLHAGALVRAAGLVAVRDLRARMAGNPTEPGRLPPMQRTAAGPTRAIARGPV